MIRELNAQLRQRDFYDQNAWAGVPLSDEARQLLAKGLDTLPNSVLARFNSFALSSAFPEIKPPPPPQNNLLGYISSFVVPKMKPKIWQMSDGQPTDEYLTEVYSAVRQDIEAVCQLEVEGRVPDEWVGLSQAERISRHQKARLNKRYRPVIQWWDERVRQLQPGNPFAVSDQGSLSDAKTLLLQHAREIPESLWKNPGTRYYLPVATFYPYGARSIQRLLDSQARRSRNPVPPQAAAPSPASPTQAPGWAQSLAGRERVYEMIVGRLFGGAQHDIEREIGFFLARNPRPSGQQVATFTRGLSPVAAELVKDEGWGNLARQVDRLVIQELGKQGTQEWLAREMGTPEAKRGAAVQSLCRGVLVKLAARNDATNVPTPSTQRPSPRGLIYFRQSA